MICISFEARCSILNRRWRRWPAHAATHKKEFTMPREVAVLDAYVPAIVLLFIAGAAIMWLLDGILAYTGLYRVVWHPSLFRASLLVCICGMLGLAVYR
jgi:hypothetical protein